VQRNGMENTAGAWLVKQSRSSVFRSLLIPGGAKFVCARTSGKREMDATADEFPSRHGTPPPCPGAPAPSMLATGFQGARAPPLAVSS
jgi:hypothetical protein